MIGRLRIAAAGAIFALSAAACDGRSPSTLDPAGPGSRRIEGLWWLLLWISVAVLAVVTVLIVVAAVRSRARPGPRLNAAWGEPFVLIAGVVIPSVILTGVFVVGLRDMNALSSPGEDAELRVEVIGHDWWWEVRYPEDGVETANEVHIPTGEPVIVELTTADVLHSFWVPQLQAKKDLVPGTTNEMWLEADRPGTYRGQCAEFCGLQHANMAFYVVAHEPDDFASWLADNAAPRSAVTGSAAAGEEVFVTSACAGCHTIVGTEADSDVGPDLTHFASRTTIAAGVLDNSRPNLARWLLDPQDVKPGAVMPPTELTEPELEALLDYLESLE